MSIKSDFSMIRTAISIDKIKKNTDQLSEYTADFFIEVSAIDMTVYSNSCRKLSK